MSSIFVRSRPAAVAAPLPRTSTSGNATAARARPVAATITTRQMGSGAYDLGRSHHPSGTGSVQWVYTQHFRRENREQALASSTPAATDTPTGRPASSSSRPPVRRRLRYDEPAGRAANPDYTPHATTSRRRCKLSEDTFCSKCHVRRRQYNSWLIKPRYRKL